MNEAGANVADNNPEQPMEHHDSPEAMDIYKWAVIVMCLNSDNPDNEITVLPDEEMAKKKGLDLGELSGSIMHRPNEDGSISFKFMMKDDFEKMINEDEKEEANDEETTEQID